MLKNRLLVIMFSLAALVCATNIAVAAGSGGQTSAQTLTGVLSSSDTSDGILTIGERHFALGDQSVVLSRTNKYISIHRLRRGMTIKITYQQRGAYQFPLVNTIQIVR